MKKRIFTGHMKKRIAAVVLTAALLGSTSIAAVAADPIKSWGNFNFKNGEAVFYAEDLHYLNNKVEEQIAVVTEGKKQLADTSAQKGSAVTAASNTPTFGELSTAVANIGTQGTATAADVLAGKTIYNGTGYTSGTLALTGNATAANVLSNSSFYSDSLSKQTGTMKNLAGASKTVPVLLNNMTGTVAIPEAGYYDTTSTLTFSVDSDNFFKPNGNATPEQVLSGQTFYSNSTQKKTGTMANYGNKSQNAALSANGNTGTVSVPATGYYDTGSSLTVDLSGFASQVQQGAFQKIASVDIMTPDKTNTRYTTIDCTGISGWQNLTKDNFLAVPAQAKIFIQNSSSSGTYDFSGSLGDLNNPGRNIFEYDSNTGVLKLFDNGTDGTPAPNDVVMLWYSIVDVYVWRK